MPRVSVPGFFARKTSNRRDTLGEHEQNEHPGVILRDHPDTARPGHWLLGAINRCDQRKNFEEAEAKAIVVEEDATCCDHESAYGWTWRGLRPMPAFDREAELMVQHSPLWHSYTSSIILSRGSATGGKNEAINCLVSVTNYWLLNWKQCRRECCNLLPTRWLSRQLCRSDRRHGRANP